jgi:hypothetical protein
VIPAFGEEMEDAGRLLDETLRFVLSGVERELRRELDWRAVPAGVGRIRRVAIYSAALLRDLVRIPLHHPEGIAQARFRVRIRYLERSAIPTIGFFVNRYPLSAERHSALHRALAELEACVRLVQDGRLRAVDEWYATMDEFRRLDEGCGRAADALASALAGRPVDSVSHDAGGASVVR